MASVLRRWPLAVLLVALALFVDVEAMVRLQTAGRGWVVPGVVVVAALALLAEARPVASALGAVATIVVSSVLLRAVGAELPGGLTATEAGAMAALIVALVRQVAPVVAAGLTGLILAGGVVAVESRPEFWPATGGPDSWWSLSLQAIAMATIPVAYGIHLRARDRKRARASRAAVLAAQQRERLELARELRDVVALQVGEMVERVRAAQELSAADPDAAARVLPVIENSGIDALSAMRRLVAALRDVDQPAARNQE